jgi:hypothetical protein
VTACSVKNHPALGLRVGVATTWAKSAVELAKRTTIARQRVLKEILGNEYRVQAIGLLPINSKIDHKKFVSIL